MRLIGIFAAVACFSASGEAAPPAPVASYDVQWTGPDFPDAVVHARLPSKDCTFGTAKKWASFFEGNGGWSQFIRMLRARDANGRPATIRVLDGGRWAIGNDRKACVAELDYRVDFSFARKQWEAGNEQVAYVSGQALYATGLPLFVHGDPGPATLAVSTPPDWGFDAPWARIGPRRYAVTSQDQLLNNVFVVGRTYMEDFKSGRFDISTALLGLPDSSAAQVRTTFGALAPLLVRRFGDDSAGRYMIVIMRGPEDGESYADSFAVSTQNPLAADNRIVWANHLSHELIHYWIGKAIRPPEDEEASFKWFTEGFTEYLANRSLLDSGIYSPADFRARMSHHLGYYLMTRQNPMFKDTSLKAAGQKGWANRPLIYSGGATLAFCLDGMIRRNSGSTKDLFSMLADLHKRARAGGLLSDAEIVRSASAAAGEDLRSYFDRYAAGSDVLPVEQCAAMAGMRAYVQGYDVFLQEASASPVNR